MGTDTVQYVRDGSKLLQEIHADYTITFLYDDTDALIGFRYGGNNYYYGADSLGVIHYVYNEAGSMVVTYTYDAWGNTVSATGNSTLIGVNPIRYKSYYYDSETGFFYLQSRYYDPAVGRFVSADEVDYLGASGTLLSYNLYSYCENDPINRNDYDGHFSGKSKVIGWGIQIVFDATIGWAHFFGGFEFIWYFDYNNYKNGIFPWIYSFWGFNINVPFDVNALYSNSGSMNLKKGISIANLKTLAKKLSIQNVAKQSSLKDMLGALGITASVNVSLSIFIVSAKKFKDPTEYEGAFGLNQTTILGVTISKGFDKNNNITTYGVGITGQINFLRLTINLLSFGKGYGSSSYHLLNPKSKYI